MNLSQRFKLSVTLGAVILFIVMFISLATQKKEEINEIDYEWCARTADVEAEFIRNGNETAESACELLASENCPQMNCDLMIMIERDEKEWYPGKLTASGDYQEIPEVTGTSHEKFKELCRLYGLDASKIWELENKYNLREGMLLAVLVSETSGGHNGAYVNEGCYNLGNVGNRDNGDRVCFEGKWESVEKVAQTLNNKYLGHAVTLGCLSNAGSCLWWDDTGHRYATSDGNREKNMKAVLNAIYQEELGEEVDPSRFVVKRVLFQ